MSITFFTGQAFPVMFVVSARAHKVAVIVTDLGVAVVAATIDQQVFVVASECLVYSAGFGAFELMSAVVTLAIFEECAPVASDGFRLLLFLVMGLLFFAGNNRLDLLFSLLIISRWRDDHFTFFRNLDVLGRQCDLVSRKVKTNVGFLQKRSAKADMLSVGTIGSKESAAEGSKLLEVVLWLQSNFCAVEIEFKLA